MISLRAIKNHLLKHFNDTSLVVYKYYNHIDDLEYVEVFTTRGVHSERILFKDNYLHEWERKVNMCKYKEGCKSGAWVELYEGYDFDQMQLISKEFYTK